MMIKSGGMLSEVSRRNRQERMDNMLSDKRLLAPLAGAGVVSAIFLLGWLFSSVGYVFAGIESSGLNYLNLSWLSPFALLFLIDEVADFWSGFFQAFGDIFVRLFRRFENWLEKSIKGGPIEIILNFLP